MQKIGDITDTADGNGEFTDGSVAGNVQPTELMAAWFTTVQREIIAVLTEAGIEPDKANDAQLNEAIKIIMKREVDGSGFLLSKNNLSDLASAEESRGHLGLKTASTKDTVTSMVDAAADKVPVVGWQGLGGESPILTDAELVSKDGAGGRLFKQTGGSTNKHFGAHGIGVHLLYGKSGDSTQQLTGNLFIDSSGNLSVEYLAININDGSVALQRIQKLYGALNKPAASDIDAVSASQGGTFQKPVTFNQGLNSRGKITWGDYSNAVGSSNYNAMSNVFDSTGKMRWAFGPYQNFWSIYAYNTDGSYKGLAFGIDHTTFNATVGGTITPGNYSNFDARYQAKGNYAAVGASYTKAESDGRYQPKGNYAAVGASYTKAESDAKYVQGVQLGARALSASANGSGGNLYLPAGCVATGYTSPGSSNANDVKFYYKPIQRNINGSWVTISG